MDNYLALVEFAYILCVRGRTKHALFEVVYGFNSMTPLDLTPRSIKDRVCIDGKKGVEQGPA